MVDGIITVYIFIYRFHCSDANIPVAMDVFSITKQALMLQELQRRHP